MCVRVHVCVCVHVCVILNGYLNSHPKMLASLFRGSKHDWQKKKKRLA